jgi:predicted restriction endonuclease
MTTYETFLQSPQWQSTRRLALEHYGYRCVLCGSKAGLEVHHRRYVRWGDEKLADLTVLCGPHHRMIHAQDEKLALAV